MATKANEARKELKITILLDDILILIDKPYH